MKIEVLKPGDINARVYQFGVRIDDQCREKLAEQFAMAHKTYNDIVAEIRRVDSNAIEWLQERAGEEAATIRSKITKLSEQFDAFKTTDDREGLIRVAEERRAMWREWYQLMHTARKENASELKLKFMDSIGERKECPTYKIRSAAVSNGLGWATGNAVLKAAIQAHRKQWPKFKLPNFRKAADTPRRVLELQFTTKNGIGVKEVFEGKYSEVSIKSSGPGRRVYGNFAFRVGAGDSRSDIIGTVYVHRNVPEHGRVKYARLVEQRIGKDRRHYLQLVVTDLQNNREPGKENRKHMAALDFGWYYEDNGRRIAGFSDSGDPALSNILRLPAVIDGLIEQSETTKSERDRLRDELIAELKPYSFNKEPEALTEHLKVIRRLPAQHIASSRLVRLTLDWRKAAQDYEPDIYRRLETWRKRDKILWQAESHLARRARNRRRKYYENLALSIAKEFEHIVIDAPELAETAKVKNKTTGKHNILGGVARGGRVKAALYDFQQSIVNVAARFGTKVVKIQGRTSKTCSLCGGSTVTENPGDREVHCESCGEKIDRELNAAAVVWQEGMKKIAEIDAQFESRMEEHQETIARRASRKNARQSARWKSRTTSSDTKD